MDEQQTTEWLTQRDAAAYLKLSERTIRGWIKDGRLIAYRVPGGRSIRIRKSDADAVYSVPVEPQP